MDCARIDEKEETKVLLCGIYYGSYSDFGVAKIVCDALNHGIMIERFGRLKN